MLFKRLVILNTTILFLLTAVFVFFNLKSTQKIVEEEVYGSFQSAMDGGASDLENIFENARDLTLELCAAQPVQQALRSAYLEEQPADAVQEELRDYAAEMGRMFPAFNPSVWLLDANGQLRNAEDTPIPDGWLARLETANGSFVWDYYYTDYGSSVRVSHVVRDEENWDQLLGVVSVSINSDYLRYTLNSIWLGNSGIVYLLDENGNLLFPFEEGASFPEELPEEGMILGGEQQDSVFLSRTLQTNDFQIIGAARNLEALQQIETQRRMILLFAAGVLSLAALAALAITYRISTPILELAEKMKEVERGNFAVQIPTLRGRGEVVILYNNFRSMLQMRQSLIEEIYGAQVREKEAELRALQAQINPHFLYNTLDSIHWMAARYGADDIEQMVTDLSQMLRYSLNNGFNQLKIRDELTQIQSYLNIQKRRFSDSFTVQYEIDESVLDCQIIKLLLQPLVENALLHGFDESGHGGLLVLRIQSREEQIEFCVCNNGSPMDLERIAAALEQPREEASTSYGLRNLNDRLIKFYGAQSALRFAVEDGFSTAKFTIPVQK